MRDEIMEVFFTKEFQTVHIKNMHFEYWGTVNKFNKPDGIGRMIFNENSIHEGAFKNGEPTGYGRRCDVNGTLFSGTYDQGIREGKGTFIDINGKQRKGYWSHFKYDGPIGAPAAATEGGVLG
jgi:hypothetical protein